MDFNSLIRKLTAVGLPALGTALGGPAGLIVATTIANKLGVDPEPEAIAKAIVTDPAALVALRKLDAEMAATEAEVTKAELVDTQDARQVFKQSRMPSVVFAVVSVMILAFVSGVLLRGTAFDKEQWDFVKLFGPILFTAWVGCVGYFVGSSSGSAAKDARLEQQGK